MFTSVFCSLKWILAVQYLSFLHHIETPVNTGMEGYQHIAVEELILQHEYA
jgi:hypothetical protein